MSETGDRNRVFSRPYCNLVLLAAVALMPLFAWGLLGALRSNSNDPRQWLPQGFDETEKYQWLQEHFGKDEITVVSWPGCTLDDPRAGMLADALIEAPDPPLFQRAATGQRVLRQLTSPPLEIPPSEALRRLQGTLIGPDGRTTCVMLTVSPRGVEDRAAAIEHLKRVALEVCELTPDELRLGGPTVDAATIDVESQRMLLELAGLAGVVALAITWLRLRSFRLSAIVLVVAVYCTMLAMAILYFTGGNMNLVMTMLPPLIFVLSVSSAIHLINYYRDALTEDDPQHAPLRALRNGWKPCLLAFGTTALGLLSLSVSEIQPVKMFGIYAATGMLAGVGIVLALLPVALQAWPSRESTSKVGSPSEHHGVADRVFAHVSRHHGTIVVVALLLMALTGTGLMWLRSTVKLQYRFGAESKILQDYRWLEENLGPLVPMELVVHFPASPEIPLAEQLETVSAFERGIREVPNVGASLSGADFVPAPPAGGSAGNVIERVFWRRSLPDIREALQESHFFARNEQGNALWRISLRASALSDVDYGRLIDTLRTEVDPMLQASPAVDVTYTGVIPLIYKAQRELLSDLTESFLWAFALIAVTIIIVLRSVPSGLLAMIPNVFPVVIIFGLMGWLEIWIEIGSIMTASAAMGIAVDDTFHLLVWNRRGLSRGLPQQEAVKLAVRRCAGAMTLTTLICSCSLLVFSLSSFMPIRRFSWMMATLLAAALLGDLILLPAILVGPLGRAFRVRRR